jgi:hypothetical protein
VLLLTATLASTAHAAMVLEFFKGSSINDVSLNTAQPISGLNFNLGDPDQFVQVALHQTSPTTLLGANGLAAYLIQGVYGPGQVGIVPATVAGGTAPQCNVAAFGTYSLVRAYRTGVNGSSPGGNENTATAFRFGGLNLNPPPSPSVDDNGRMFLGTFQVHAQNQGSSSIVFQDPNPAAGTIDNIADDGSNVDAVLFNGTTYTLTINVAATTPVIASSWGKLKAIYR